MTDRDPTQPHRRVALKAMAAASFGLPPLARGETPLPKVLRYAFPVAETGMDPVQLVDLYSRMVTAHIFDNLYDYDHLARPFKIIPCTADGLPEVSSDFRTWTIRIRPGIYFRMIRRSRASSANWSLRTTSTHGSASTIRAGRRRVRDLHELRIVGMAALRDAATKGKKPFEYDTEVEGMRALDRYTTAVQLEAPQPRFIQLVADRR